MKLVLLMSSIIALCTQLIQSQLLTSPMNTIANLGQTVELECSTNVTLPLEWHFAEVNSTRFEAVYRNEVIERKFSSRHYDVNTSVNGSFALAIDSVDMDHAGTYRCQNTYDPKSIQRNATAHLVVIDSEPVCGTNASNSSFLEGDFIHMWCKVNYSGNYILVMEWTRNDGQTVDTYNTRTSRESIKVKSSLIKELASSDNNVTFTCKTSLNLNTINGIPAAVDITKATNILYYQYSWNYTAIVSHETLISSTAATPPNDSNDLPFETILIIGTSIGALILFLAIAVIICKIRKIGVKEAKTIDVPDQPTYGIVKKNRKDEQEHSHREEDVPVYGEVKKNKKDKKTPGQTSKNSSTTEKKTNQNYTGADGTVYEEMSAFADRKFNKAPVKQAPLFDLVDIYASIDHTTAAPPPTH